MAAYPVAAGEHGAYAKTLAASVVDTVTFAYDADYIEVWGDGTSAIYFTTDGSTPTVAGANTWELPVGVASSRAVEVGTGGGTVVKVISAGTPKYSVQEA